MTTYISDDDYVPSVYKKDNNILMDKDLKTKYEVLEILEHLQKCMPDGKSSKSRFQVNFILEN